MLRDAAPDPEGPSGGHCPAGGGGTADWRIRHPGAALPAVRSNGPVRPAGSHSLPGSRPSGGAGGDGGVQPPSGGDQIGPRQGPLRPVQRPGGLALLHPKRPPLRAVLPQLGPPSGRRPGGRSGVLRAGGPGLLQRSAAPGGRPASNPGKRTPWLPCGRPVPVGPEPSVPRYAPPPQRPAAPQLLLAAGLLHSARPGGPPVGQPARPTSGGTAPEQRNGGIFLHRRFPSSLRPVRGAPPAPGPHPGYPEPAVHGLPVPVPAVHPGLCPDEPAPEPADVPAHRADPLGHRRGGPQQPGRLCSSRAE